MNMTLSKRGDYVMRSAIALARAYDRGIPRKIREVVADTAMPRTFASQILADLARAGLAVSRAGRDGGYRLSRPPSEITVLEVVEAAEGPLRAERCALGDGPCRWEAVCPLHETWTMATARLAGLLAETTLAEVAARDVAIETGRYEVPADAHRARARAVELSEVIAIAAPVAVVHDVLGAPFKWSPVLGAAVHDAGVLPGKGPRPSALLADCTVDPIGEAGTGAPAAYLLGWRLSEPGGRSHFEGELRVKPLGAGQCEVSVAGTWHQEGDEDAPLATESLAARGGRVLRGVLRNVQSRATCRDGDPPQGPRGPAAGQRATDTASN